MTGDGWRRINRKITQAQLAIGFERFWSAQLWPLLVLGLFMAAVFSGTLTRLPDLLRYGALLLFLCAFASCLWPARLVRTPERSDAIRRLEQASGLSHHPIATLDDTPAGPSDPAVLAIWNEHKTRQLRQLGTLDVGMPRSDWMNRDHYALRVPVTLLLVASVLLGHGDGGDNLRAALRVSPLSPPAAVTVDAWLKPPTYTAKAPILLTSPAMIEKLAGGNDILVPENAVLSIRAGGLDKPSLTLLPLDGGDKPKQLADIPVMQEMTADGFTAEATVKRPMLAKLEDGGDAIAEWRIVTVPDAVPSVSIHGTPEGEASGALHVKWSVGDDYGVTGLSASISLSDEQSDGMGFSASGIFLHEEPTLTPRLRRPAATKEDGETIADLTAHPWAGFMVELTLMAKDAAGHEATTVPVRFKLPERAFTQPLARALIEQRKRLILDPDAAPDVARLLEALVIYPKGLIARSGTHIAIATVISRLDNLRDTDDVLVAISALWKIAVQIEEGTSADSRADIEALRKQLEKALAEGAPPERIKELMDKLRDAIDRYAQSLADQQQKDDTGPQQSRTISPDDLKKMMDDIEKLAESGAKDAARDLLAQLDEILRNLKSGKSQQQGEDGSQGMGKMLDKLGDVMRDQQKLMDETQRMQQPGEGKDPNAPGQSGDPQQGGEPALGDKQQRLGQSLSDLMDELGRNGLDGKGAMEEAQGNMKRAEGALRQGEQDKALGEQGQALGNLRQAMRDMLRQMQQPGQGQSARDGEGRNDGHDPLGRPRASRGDQFGPDRDMLPSERAIRRAQEILEQLRARANQPEMPRLERDYIDRLLRGLY